MKKTYMALTAGLLILAGCSNDDFNGYKDNEGAKTITSLTATLNEKADTRMHIINGWLGGDKQFGWQSDDRIEVYSDLDPELKEYYITNFGEDETIATFAGESVYGNTFYAFFPRPNNRTEYQMITVDEDDYELLHVKYGNSYTAHPFTDEDFFTYAPMVAVSDGNGFAFKQTTGMLHFSVTGIDEIAKVILRGNNGEPLLGNGYIDLSQDEPQLVIEQGDSEMEIWDVSSSMDEIHIYFCIPPTTFTKGITLEIWTEESNSDNHIIKTLSEPMTVGRAQVKTFPIIDINAVQQNNDPIVFADPKVKAICVANWDSNGDGELSYSEAANVTNINQVFYNKEDIESFDEFQYFTGVSFVNSYAFFYCYNLKSIIIPENVESISIQAFDRCRSLSSINIPDGVTTIERGAFNECSSLTSITIPDGVTQIGYQAFKGCSSLTSINIPEGVTEIGYKVFAECSSLTSIIIPESITSIGEDAFSYCSSLTNINIPESVTTIGNAAFYECSSLTSINIPESVTTIEGGAFHGCSSLTSIIIPEGVTSISNGVFEECTSLSSITIPNKVTSIGEYAFYDCSSLTSINIPESVISIEERAFFGCSTLTNIIILCNTPPALGWQAIADSSSAIIYVPAASVDAYKESWSGHANRIQAIPE